MKDRDSSVWMERDPINCQYGIVTAAAYNNGRRIYNQPLTLKKEVK